MQKINVPTYSTKPLPVNSLVGVQTQGTVAELCTGERHTLVITTKGQVLAFGDNTKYALGSKQLMEGRNSRSRSSTRPNTAAPGGEIEGTRLPSLLAAATTVAAEQAMGTRIPGSNNSSSSSSSGTVGFSKKADTLASDKRKWHQQDKAPRIFNTADPVEVDLHRAGCLIPVHVYAGAHSSYVMDGSGKLYAWGENHHGQCGVGPLDFDGLNDDDIKKQLDTMRKGPTIRKAKRWKAPGSTDKAQDNGEENNADQMTFFAPTTQESKDSNATQDTKEMAIANKRTSNSSVNVRKGSVSGLRRGGGYTTSSSSSAMAKKSAKDNWETVRQDVVVAKEAEEEEKEDPMRYGVVVTNRLEYKGAVKPMKRRAYVQRPLLISALAHKRVKMLSCGHRHCCALMLGGGLLYTWGFNRFGQLGLGGKERTDFDFEDRDVPIVVTTMRKVRCSHVSCGRHFTVALGETDDDRFLGMKLGGKLRR